MNGSATKWVFAIIPPQDENPAVTRWRYSMVAVLILVAGGVLFTYQAHSGGMDDVKKGLLEDRIERMEMEIFDLRLKQCAAQGRLQLAYANQLSEQIGKWMRLTGNETYPLQSCSELGITRGDDV